MKNCLAFFFFLTLFTSVNAQTDSTANDTVQIAAPDFIFEVQAVDKVVLLKWNVAFSDDLKGFDIERAENGEGSFVKVGSKLAISKGSDADYDFVDATPKRNVLLRYRLKLISQNGSISYSDFRETKLPDATFTARLKQNPVRNNLELELVTTTARTATVIVIANRGQQVATQTFRLTEGANQFSISANNFPSGMYQLAIEAGTERKTIPFIKE
ncbi:T9SS type A sorting domain-containing protein [Flavisolibacter sp. BT320]|nr:T9SS type A sorting domain-containing protein [Flavisolibacter longurius]